MNRFRLIIWLIIVPLINACLIGYVLMALHNAGMLVAWRVLMVFIMVMGLSIIYPYSLAAKNWWKCKCDMSSKDGE